MPKRRKRLLTPARKRAISLRMTWCVIALQAALLLTLAVTPTDPPNGPHLLQRIWASMHKPTFYPLIALLIAGPILSYLAWRTKGNHRVLLILAWLAFIAVMYSAFSERTLVMLHVLWYESTG